jgi:hypothetical protein
MRTPGIHNLLIIWVFTTAVNSAHADFESARQAYRTYNYRVAFEEFLPLAKNGDPRAQTIIAMMYKHGESIEQDYRQAFKWYLAAAEQGYPSAQRSLAELYESGNGVDPDPDKATYWFTLSMQQGSQSAAENDKTNKSGSESPSDSQNWSRDWNFMLPKKDLVDADESGSVNPPNDTAIYWVQLGAMKSSATAHQLWIVTSEPNQDLFEGLQHTIKSNSVETGTLFRLRTGPFDSLGKAKHFCDVLSGRGVESGCLPIKSIEKNQSN